MLKLIPMIMPMEKMYSDENRPTDIELEDLKIRLLIEVEKLL